MDVFFSSNWPKNLASGSLDIPIPTASLRLGQNCAAHGAARVIWTNSARVTLHVTTINDDAFHFRLGSIWEKYRAGQLYSMEDHVCFHGTVDHFFTVDAPSVAIVRTTRSSDGNSTVWELSTPRICFKRPWSRSPDTSPRFRAVIGPPSAVYRRLSETEYKNELFGSSFSTGDWFKADAEFGVIAGRRLTTDWAELLIDVAQCSPTHGSIAFIRSTTAALSLLDGIYVTTRGYVDPLIKHDEYWLITDPPRPSTDATLPPLGRFGAYRSDAEKFIAKAADFFLTPLGWEAYKLLSLIWDTTEASMPTHALVTSIVVEGLVKLISPKSRGASNTQAPDYATFLDILGKSKSLLSESFINRAISRLALPNGPKQILQRWQGEGLMAINEREVAAWSKLRNASAHADIPPFDRSSELLQQHIFDQYAVKSLINKLLLQLINYRGPFVNYSLDSWPEQDFPLADASAL